MLDPFDVTSKPVKGYVATNSISGTAMNMPLKEVPMSINVITSEFLDDALVGELAAAFDYNASITQTNRQPVFTRNAVWSIRGFRTRNTLIDGVLAGEYVPTQMIDRIEVVKGPNTLYGQSDPGGLINIISKRPSGSTRASIAQKIGEQSLFETVLDAETAVFDKRLGLRLVGTHRETDGWRPVDGSRTDFIGLAADYQISRRMRFLFHGSGSRSSGNPAQRGTWSFQSIPTDFNGDGDTLDRINGVPEATARFNNTFLPRNFTSQTPGNRFEQHNRYLQTTLRHLVSDAVTVQYTFFNSFQDLMITAREFNTFSPAGTVQADHVWSDEDRETNVHTLNAHATATTGSVDHRILLGVRLSYDDNDGNGTYRLRAANAAERAVLQGMISQGRRIRLVLTKNDVLSGVPFWRDDVPTGREIFALGTRNNDVRSRREDVKTFYLTDSITLLNNRLKVLGGIRRINIVSQATNTAGRPISAKNDQSDTSYQLGGIYDVTPRISAFANAATAFEPNSTDPNTGVPRPPEEAQAYEVGLKFDRLLGDRVTGSIAAFVIDKQNVIRSDFNPVLFRNDTEMTDDQVKGFEAEVFFSPREQWHFVLSYSYLDAHVVKSVTEARNLRLEGAPPHRLAIWTSFGFERGPLKGLRMGGGLVGVKGPVQQFGTSENQHILENGYTEFDAFVRYDTRLFKRALTLGLNIDNVTDVFYMRSRAGTNSPRQTVFSMKMKF